MVLSMLKPLNLNLLSGLVIAIVLLGVVSAVTVYVNAQTYRDLAFDFFDIGFRQSEQEDSQFRMAFDSSDYAALAQVLQTAYHRAPVTSGLIDAVGIYVFDINFTLLGYSLRESGTAENR